jgi:PAS domain S-box-containing protein
MRIPPGVANGRTRPRPARRASRYGLAVLASVAALALTIAVPSMHERPYLVPMGAIVLAAWYGGAGPALAATAIPAIAVNVFLTRGTPWGWVEALQGAVFVGLGVMVAAVARAHRRTLREVRRQAALLETMFGQASVGIALADLDGRVTRVNRRFAEIVGRSEPDASRLTCQSLTHPDDWTHVAPGLRAVADGRRRELASDLRYLRGDGSPVWVHVSVAPRLDADGRPEGLIAVVQDVSERPASEDALRRADREKDDFLAMLAHELRNPLAPIRTAVEILQRHGTSDADGRRLHAVIERQVQHLVRMVDDLLDVSRVLRGKVDLHEAPASIADVVAMAVETTRPLIDAQRQDLHVSLPERPLYVYGDQVRLAQVFANLLSNASKFTPRDGTIRLTASGTAEHVELRVSDSGVGIASDLLPRIFEPFVQADRSLERSRGGLGIGLTLVKKIVELHGGSVSASSAGPGQGSELVVRLPALADAAISATRRAPDGARALPPQRILVVDDNVDAAESLALLLRASGHDVRTAHSGPEAVAAVATWRPQVAVLDIGLPGMSGYDVATTLRQRADACPDLIAVTGYGQASDAARALAAGFDHHLAKPVAADALEAAIAGCVAARTARRASSSPMTPTA